MSSPTVCRRWYSSHDAASVLLSAFTLAIVTCSSFPALCSETRVGESVSARDHAASDTDILAVDGTLGSLGMNDPSRHASRPLPDYAGDSDSLSQGLGRTFGRPRAARLPKGIDPMEVVCSVEETRSSLSAETQKVGDADDAGDIGPPFLVGNQTAYGLAWLDQRCVAVASDGSDYLVVWSDARNAVGPISSELYGARVAGSGEVLDPCGILISTAVGNQSWPSVVFCGSHYLVVWEDHRNYDGDIYCARVSVSGNVLDPDGVPVCTFAEHQLRPTAAFDGENCIVAWQDWRSGAPDIYGTRVTQAANVLDPAGIEFCVSPGDQYHPEIAFGVGKYLLVWQDFRSGLDWDIYGTRIDTSGTVLDTSGIAILTGFSHQWSPDVAADGANYLVVWADGRATGSDVYSDIYGARVDTAGTVTDPGGTAISTASYMQHWPAIEYDGTNFVVVWEDKRNGLCDIYAARVSTSGSVIDPLGLLISSAADEQYYPALAFNGTGYLVAWDDYRTSDDWNTFGSRLSTAGSVLDPAGIMISSVANQQHWPAVAFDGVNYLVVWYDTWTGSSDIYGARVDTCGSVLDPTGILISGAPGDQSLPSVAFDGSNYLVVWEDFRSLTEWDIYGARVDPSGSVLDPSGIAISTASSHQWAPSLASDGVNCLVSWADARASGVEAYSDVYGTRVNASGTVLDPAGFVISADVNMQHWPALAFDGENYMVVWQDTRSGGSSHIYGARLTPSGNVLDPSGIPVSTVTDEEYLPSIAFDGTHYLVVWEDDRNGSDNLDIYGTRVTPSGVVLSPAGVPISTAAYHQLYPSVTFDGSAYVVVWQDLRNGRHYDIYAARVRRSGVVLDGEGVIISSSSKHELYPAVCGAGSGDFSVFYSTDTPLIQSCRSYRIAGNMWYGVHIGPDCVAYWAFDEGAGGIVRDSALANHGTAYNTAWVEGVRGSALSFNGVNSYVHVQHKSVFDLSDAVTIEAWVRMVPLQSWPISTVFDKSRRVTTEPPHYSGYSLCGSSSQDYCLAIAACNGSSCFESNSIVALNDSTWHFVAGTISSQDSVIRFYLDGELAMEQPIEGAVGVNDGDVFMGRWWYGGDYFAGAIDEVKVYDVALTPAEILDHFSTGYTDLSEDGSSAPSAPKDEVFLAQNTPNPFNPATSVSFYLANPARIELSVFDVTGRRVSILCQGFRDSGWHSSDWRTADLPSGVYFLKLEAGAVSRVRKAVLLR